MYICIYLEIGKVPVSFIFPVDIVVLVHGVIDPGISHHVEQNLPKLLDINISLLGEKNNIYNFVISF